MSYNSRFQSNFQKVSPFFLIAQVLAGVLFLLFPNVTEAKNCGDGVDTCVCGDTVVADYTLTSDMNCTGHGLIIGADGITIDGDNHTITGDGGSSDYGIDNSGGYDNVTIQNFANITNFNRGIYLKNSTGSTVQNNIINSSACGIYLDSSSSNTLTGNTASSNSSGIYLSSSSSSNILTGNTANSNTSCGIYLSSSSNTLTGNTANSNTHYGIYLFFSSSNILSSNIANSNNRGIYLSSSSSNTLTGNTANSNTSCGIYLSSSSSNTLTGNTANSNAHYGIYLYSSSNTLTGNTANSNARYGIYLLSSSSNKLKGNTMSENTYNLYIYGTTAQYDNTIDTTNTVEGKPVYYFYDNDGTAENPLVYDGNTIGDIGMFWCISCDYVQVKNATLSANNYYGVYFNNTTHSTIENIVASLNRYGIYLESSSSNTLTGNTASLNTNGIYLSLSSSSNTLTGNTASLNTNGIYFSFSSSNTLTGNTISNNKQDIEDNGTNTYSSNQFNHNLTSKMLTFTEVIRTKNLNDTISFSISAFNPNGAGCNGCTAVTTFPSETVTIDSETGNDITGHFTVTRPGIYSLNFTVTDSNSNITKRRMLFFVGNTSQQTTKYYFRGIKPTHGQPKDSDCRSLLLTAPSATEAWTCGYWIQNSPDEIPNYPLAYLSGIDTYSWYETALSEGYIGVQRFVTYDSGVDFKSTVPIASDYTWINKNFTNLNWSMDYPQSWYWLSLKLEGDNPYWTTFPVGHTADEASYADFTYSYTTTPTIESISNTDIVVLSATSPADDTDSATIVLENPTSSAASTNLVLASFNKPFSSGASTINSNGNTTLATGNIAASSVSTFNSVDMEITPSSDSVDITIDTWNTSGTYYKKWIETASGSLSVSHTIGDLKANTYYTVKVDSARYSTYLSNSSGEISFTYTGEYSDHEFEVEEDTTSPDAFTLSSPASDSSTSNNPPTLSWNPSSDSESGLAKYQLYIDGSLYRDNISSTSVTLTSSLSCAPHTWYVKAVDKAGNSTNSSTFSLTITCPKGGGFMPVKAPPEGFGVSINKGKKKTSKSLVTLNLEGGEAEEMMISNFSDFRDAEKEPYQEEKEWDLCKGKALCQEGEHRVYVKFFIPWKKDPEPVSDSILLGESQKSLSQMTLSELKGLLIQIKQMISQLKQGLIIPEGFTFKTDLRYGDNNQQVRYLQIFLKKQGKDIYPQGIVSGWFGPLTKAAVIKFQETYADDILAPWGLHKGNGFVGQTTRAKINEILGR